MFFFYNSLFRLQSVRLRTCCARTVPVGGSVSARWSRPVVNAGGPTTPSDLRGVWLCSAVQFGRELTTLLTKLIVTQDLLSSFLLLH